jgi:N,N'-diacetyllegionaminate synthase
LSNKTIQIGQKTVGGENPAYVIAEAGANHNGDIGHAKELVSAAREAGADCIKFQTFTAEEFCADRIKTYTYQSQGKTVVESEFEMFKRLEFSRDEWAELMQHCKDQEIQFLTTIQDPVNLDMMLELGLVAIKVGSDDFDYLANLKLFAATGLPLIISKGMANLGEVDKVTNALASISDNLAVLHCVSLYPADPAHLNILQIPKLAALYPDIVWGFSDHSQGALASTVAVALGAKIIEKHFTLDHNMPGPDQWFSMNPSEMKKLVEDIRYAEVAIGKGRIAPSEEELKTREIMRRRIVARTSLAIGDIIDEEAVSFKRADSGIFVSDWDLVAGQKLKSDILPNASINMSDIDFES